VYVCMGAEPQEGCAPMGCVHELLPWAEHVWASGDLSTRVRGHLNSHVCSLGGGHFTGSEHVCMA